uniref:Uncharacterized protein n=1 Tax=Oryza meridionalis TaxID=40149 RepID=A0A0E0E0T2_9ORYZ
MAFSSASRMVPTVNLCSCGNRVPVWFGRVRSAGPDVSSLIQGATSCCWQRKDKGQLRPEISVLEQPDGIWQQPT